MVEQGGWSTPENPEKGKTGFQWGSKARDVGNLGELKRGIDKRSWWKKLPPQRGPWKLTRKRRQGRKRTQRPNAGEGAQ